MTKLTLVALSLLSMATPAKAEVGNRSYHAANCTISLKMQDGGWRQVNNDCFMGRDFDTNETAVKMGEAYLLISRDDDERGVAKLYMISAQGKRSFAGTAIARGACWIGTTIKFCSP
jgi:hypothetical protein